MEKELCLHLASHYQQINHNHNNDSIRIGVQLEKKKSYHPHKPNKKALKAQIISAIEAGTYFSTDIINNYVEPANNAFY